MPKELISTKLKKGEFATRSCNQVLNLKWNDKKDMSDFPISG